MGWPMSYHLNGDNHKLASPRAKANQIALEEATGQGLKMNVIQWDVCNLPIRTASIDVIVTDLVSVLLAVIMYHCYLMIDLSLLPPPQHINAYFVLLLTMKPFGKK